MKCKLCGSDSASPSHRRPVERYLKYIIPRAPYRCKECWGRFWVFENPYTTWTSRLGALGVVCLLGVAIVWLFASEPPSRTIHLADRSAEEDDRINRRKLIQRTYEPTSESAPEPLPAEETPVGVPETPVSGETPSPDGDKPAVIERPEITEETIPPATPAPTVEKDGNETAGAPTNAADSGPPETTPADSTTGAASEEASSEPVAEPETVVSEGSASESPSAGKAVVPKPKVEIEPSSESSETVYESRIPVKKPVAEKPRFFRLDAIRTARSGAGLELILVAGEPIENYEIFPLESPPKLVIDLKGNWKPRMDKALSVDTPLISRIRLGEHPDYLRVVLDLKAGPAPVPEASAISEGLRVLLRR